MTEAELALFSADLKDRYNKIAELGGDLDPGSRDIESQDLRSDGFAEAIFLRAFTIFENAVETMFLHYVTGGLSLTGVRAETYLRITDIDHARRLTKGAYRFLGWAKPQSIKTVAKTYIKDGWPLVDMIATKGQTLADCERVRNRIAHDSPESRSEFNVVQRNFLQTERLFDITAGQFLRIRSQKLKKSHILHFIDELRRTLEALIQPRP